MSTSRVCVLLVAFAAVALWAVYLRTEQARLAARTLQLELRQVEVRRDLWDLQASIARLRAPAAIHGRVDYVAAGLVGPVDETQPTTTNLRIDAPAARPR